MHVKGRRSRSSGGFIYLALQTRLPQGVNTITSSQLSIWLTRDHRMPGLSQAELVLLKSLFHSPITPFHHSFQPPKGITRRFLYVCKGGGGIRIGNSIKWRVDSIGPDSPSCPDSTFIRFQVIPHPSLASLPHPPPCWANHRSTDEFLRGWVARCEEADRDLTFIGMLGRDHFDEVWRS